MPSEERRRKPLSDEVIRRRERMTKAAIEKRQLKVDEATDRRVTAAISWYECCIPGCGTKTYTRGLRDVSCNLPLCNRHLVIILKRGSYRDEDPDVLAARGRWARQQAHNLEKHERALANGGLVVPGQIYFVRQNGLVKVGWSAKLENRLRQYGANVEILCHFPATRDDETNLHRQLRPYLARGREWYEDCPLIHDVVAGYIKQHGEPVIKPYWTKPKKPTVRPRRAS